MSGCKFPEHHGGAGFDVVPIAIVVGLVALGATAITAIIHVLTMILTFVALGAAVTAALGIPLWLHRRHVARELAVQYRPQMGPPRRTGLPREQRQAIGQQVIPTADEIADALIRRYQGSRNGR